MTIKEARVDKEIYDNSTWMYNQNQRDRFKLKYKKNW